MSNFCRDHKILETYVYYNEPLLYCAEYNDYWYLVVQVEEHEWLAVAVSPQRLDAIKAGTVDLATAFGEPESGAAMVADYQQGTHRTITAEQIPPEWLCKNGVTLFDEEPS